ncbi:hypothetical protein BCR34DRAFT_667948 [Clohesyomyces aquaticus]|uniref:Uncharacterized protein n=1 Tax=Clohesyomyces aquaticus TaxID=1231657 RepID=A0A1Y1YU10_9PLEO|nr:hypothetical protein BCR34DRAFT_667948 [Clohesyomyces aquaticus]
MNPLEFLQRTDRRLYEQIKDLGAVLPSTSTNTTITALEFIKRSDKRLYEQVRDVGVLLRIISADAATAVPDFHDPDATTATGASLPAVTQSITKAIADFPRQNPSTATSSIPPITQTVTRTFTDRLTTTTTLPRVTVTELRTTTLPRATFTEARQISPTVIVRMGCTLAPTIAAPTIPAPATPSTATAVSNPIFRNAKAITRYFFGECSLSGALRAYIPIVGELLFSAGCLGIGAAAGAGLYHLIHREELEQQDQAKIQLAVWHVIRIIETDPKLKAMLADPDPEPLIAKMRDEVLKMVNKHLDLPQGEAVFAELQRKRANGQIQEEIQKGQDEERAAKKPKRNNGDLGDGHYNGNRHNSDDDDDDDEDCNGRGRPFLSALLDGHCPAPVLNNRGNSDSAPRKRRRAPGSTKRSYEEEMGEICTALDACVYPDTPPGTAPRAPSPISRPRISGALPPPNPPRPRRRKQTPKAAVKPKSPLGLALPTFGTQLSPISEGNSIVTEPDSQQSPPIRYRVNESRQLWAQVQDKHRARELEKVERRIEREMESQVQAILEQVDLLGEDLRLVVEE